IASTFIGGDSGEWLYGFNIDDEGRLLISGYTSSSDFPTNETTPIGATDAFVMILPPDLSGYHLSERFGGTSADSASNIIFDSDGNLYLKISTRSDDFPMVGDPYDNLHDCFSNNGAIVKLNITDLSIMRSTYFGGPGNVSFSIEIDTDGDIILAGKTDYEIPITTDAYDSTLSGNNDYFIAELDSELSELKYSSYIGGDDREGINSGLYMTKDAVGNICLLGSSASSDFPTTPNALNSSYNGGMEDGVILIFDMNSSSLLYSSYIGTEHNYEFWNGLVFDFIGTAYIVGGVKHENFFVTDGAYDTTYNGGDNDAFIVKFLNLGVGLEEPLNISSLELYSDPAFNTPLEHPLDFGSRVYIQIEGEDRNASIINYATINISYSISKNNRYRFMLTETDINTGVFRSQYVIPPTARYFESVEIASYKDDTFRDGFIVDYPFRPTGVSSVMIYEDEGLLKSGEIIDFGETAYISVSGNDGNPLMRDKAFLNLSSDKNASFSPLIICRETGLHTGEYAGEFTVPKTMVWFENITATSVRDPLKIDTFKVHTPVQIRPFMDPTVAYEDEEFRNSYWNFGWFEEPSWTLTADREWIQFDPGTLELYGTPDNGDVGITNVELNLTDDSGHFDAHQFKITVENLDPILIGENVLTATQDQLYYMDYDSTDEGVGNTTYHIWTSAQWLTMNEVTGELSGTPTNDDVGRNLIGVSVHDGNGGVDNTQFNLTIIDVNDGCFIDTENILTVYQDEPYRRTYTAIDLDPADSFTWALVTDAEWLSMDQYTGVLEGAPTNDDVGTSTVNITVMDSGGLTDSTEFQLEVLNINDRPEWIEVPEDSEITHGEFYYFEAYGADVDTGTTLSYTIITNPDSVMMIDSETGTIEWHSTIHIFQGLSKKMEVTVGVFDGGLYNNYTFVIEVLPSRAPSVTLQSPTDGDKVSSTMAVLTWEGSDPEGDELIYSLYLSKEEPLVSTLQETAMIKTDFNATSFTPGILEVGETYYWTVIPDDGCADGRCSNDVFSFEV
ncbi:MAG: hypothetical protein KAH57_08710, partial [Thermoplasmata archaeon]|nr:hypothetical protein [Thermoplasmata archaeon]